MVEIKPAFEGYLTTGEVARKLSISVQRLWTIINQGRIPYTSTPLGRLFCPEDIDEFMAERAKTQGD